jgi:hypothetical protein
MKLQTIAVTLGVALFGIGANDAAANEDWVCGPSERIRELMHSPVEYSDIYKWIVYSI